MTDRELDRLLHYMPIVLRSKSLTDWERKFCAGIVRRQQAGPFTPSLRQQEIMQRLVSQFLRESLG